MSERLVITGGRVMDPANGVDRMADVLVEKGRVRLLAPGETVDGARVLDAAGCIVAPGFVDLHTHLREPGFEHKGTIATETAAAAAGGFATVCAMPNTEPAPDSGTAVESLLERIEARAAVRVFPVGCVTAGRSGEMLADLSELAAAGVIAYSDDGSPVANATVMRRALEAAGALGLPLSEHADDPAISGAGVMHEGRVSERLGLPGVAAAAEVAAIARDIALAEATGAHLHIGHVSSGRSVELVAEAKGRGVWVTCEVTPSHLFLTEDAVFGEGVEPAYDSNARINPPLRSEEDRRALVAGLEAGVIDAIATDHAPHAVEDKLCEFEEAAPGISCLETALGTVLSLVERGELSLGRALEALTAGPARVFPFERFVTGLGALGEGSPADIVVFAPDARWRVDPERFRSLGRNTPLAGCELVGRVRATLVGGRLVYEHAEEEVPA